MSRTPLETAESYWRAECARDIEAILAHYHEDAEFRPGSQVLRGHAEIRTFYEDSIARFPGLENEIVHHIETDDEGVFEWHAALIDHAGARLELDGANVVRIRDGKFTSVHAYFDASRYQEP